MKIKPRSFPYPVLSKFSDDISPNDFVANLKVIPSTSAYILDFDVQLTHTEIGELISSGTAALIVHVECQTNFYRRSFTFQNLAGDIQIPVGELTGRVEVTFMIVAANAIEKYRVSGFHSDYGDIGFEIKKSDLLGLLETIYFIAEKDPNVLQKISSIIQVARLEDSKAKAWEIELDDQKIFVRMPTADYERYGLIKESQPITRSLCTVIVIPALIEALYQVKGTSDNDVDVERERRWFRVLETKLVTLGINLQDTGKSMFEIAQLIMEHPAPDTLKELDVLTEG